MSQRMPQRLPPRRKIYTAANQFDYDESKKPPDMEYQFIATTVAGMETRNAIIAEMNGWRPVPAERHPELAGINAQKGSSIDIGGQRLYEIPKQYHEESKELDEFAAKDAVESQVARLGLQARQNGAKGVRRTMEKIEGEAIE